MRVLDDNVAYKLTEVDGMFGKEICVVSKQEGASLQLTPAGAATLGEQLIVWISEQVQ